MVKGKVMKTRTEKQRLRAFKSGAKMVAEKLELKIQPVIITNSKSTILDTIRSRLPISVLSEDIQEEAAYQLAISDFALMYDPDDGQSFVDFARGGPLEDFFSGKL
jgi:1-acyl-sn-glycerol-3-phosphate acyltransferase